MFEGLSVGFYPLNIFVLDPYTESLDAYCNFTCDDVSGCVAGE